MATKATYRHPANRARWDAMQGKRSSNAATPHQDRRTRRTRTRSSARQAAIRSHAE